MRIELALVRSYEGAPLMADMLPYLAGLGFRLCGIEEAWSNRATQEVYEVDAVLFRTERAGGGTARWRVNNKTVMITESRGRADSPESRVDGTSSGPSVLDVTVGLRVPFAPPDPQGHLRRRTGRGASSRHTL